MSRYFRYKSRDDVLRDAEQLGVDIRLDGDPVPLFRRLVIGGRTLGNRLAIHPMEGCDGNDDGTPGELTLRRYRRFGAGGAKLVWAEACAVVPEGRANPRQLVLNDATRDPIARLVDECRAAHRREVGDDGDLLIGLQLTHSGRYSFAAPIRAQDDPLLDPRMARHAVRPIITDDELMRLQDRFVEAARLARRAGFDFIDIKQCHRYLLNELLAGRGRPGSFGGSYENRTRFARELFGRLRGEAPDALLATRLNLFDGIPFQKGEDGRGEPCPVATPVRSCWGTCADDPLSPDPREPLSFIGELMGLGVELVNVSMGNPYAAPHILRPFENPPPDGYEAPEHPLVGVARHFELTARVQREYPTLAVVGSGYSWLQAFALEAGSANVRDGRVSVVGLGRAALSQPDFARRLQNGEGLDTKRVCRTFSYCTALMRSKHNEQGQFPTGCPPFDREVYGPLWTEAQDDTSGGSRQ